MNRWSVALYDPADLTAPVAEPTLVTTPTFKVARNDTGDGSVTVQATDAQAALIDVDQILVFILDDTPIHAVVVDEINYVTKGATQGERTLTISGPGALALLEDAIVEPAAGTGHLPVEEVRQLNWRGIDFDDSGPEWVAATELATITDAPIFWPSLPTDFPDYGEPDGSSVPKYIGVSGSDTTDAPADAHNYYRRHITTDEIIFDELAAADNEGDGHVDGVEVLSLPGFGTTRHIDGGMKISAGEHLLAWHQHNYIDDGAPGGNPGMLIYTLASLTPDGLMDEILTFSGSLTLVCENPATPPGMTVTDGMGKFIDEAQAATPSRLAAVIYDFTATEDSNGETMTPIADLSARVGDDLLTFARQCIDSGYCDLRMKVESDGATGIVLTFQMFKPGTLGTARPDFHPDHLTITHRKKAATATSSLTKWRDTYTSYESGVTPPKRVFLRSEQDPSEVATLERTGAIIDARKSPLIAVSATIDAGPGPNPNEPFTGLFVADTFPILMPDDTISDQLTQDITFGIDDAGHPRWLLGIKDRILEAEERIQRLQKRMASGALAGQSDAPSSLNTLSSSKGTQYRLDHEKFSYPADGNLESSQFQVSRTKDMFWLEVRLDEIWPDDVTVVVRLNDTTDTLSCTVAAGDQLDKVWYAVGTQKITTTDFYTLKITAPATPPRLSATLALR